MKLSRLYNIAEGLFGDLIKIAGASLPQKLQLQTYVATNQELKELVNLAIRADYSLLDIDKSREWWKKLFSVTGVNKDQDSLLKDIFHEISPRIDREAEERAKVIQKRAKRTQTNPKEGSISKPAIFEASFLRSLFQKNPPNPQAKQAGQEWLQLFADMLDSNKREQITPHLVRKANNERIANAAINMIAAHLIKNGASESSPFAKKPTPWLQATKRPQKPKSATETKGQDKEALRKNLLAQARRIEQLAKDGKDDEVIQVRKKVLETYGYDIYFKNGKAMAKPHHKL